MKTNLRKINFDIDCLFITQFENKFAALRTMVQYSHKMWYICIVNSTETMRYLAFNLGAGREVGERANMYFRFHHVSNHIRLNALFVYKSILFHSCFFDAFATLILSSLNNNNRRCTFLSPPASESSSWMPSCASTSASPFMEISTQRTCTFLSTMSCKSATF